MEFSLHLPLSVKMQGNEVEAVKTPTVRSWEIYNRLKNIVYPLSASPNYMLLFRPQIQPGYFDENRKDDFSDVIS
jgi:hypothetical protein